MSEDPPILGYQHPDLARAQRDPWALRKFFLGQALAIVIGVAGFSVGGTIRNLDNGVLVMLGTPVVVFFIGIVLAVARPTRMIGAGALSIVGLLGLLLLVICGLAR